MSEMCSTIRLCTTWVRLSSTLVKLFFRNIFLHSLWYFEADSLVNIIMLYDGEWKIGEMGQWTFNSTHDRGLMLPKNVSYQSLVDEIYAEMDVQKEKYELVLEVVYRFGGNIPPVEIQNDHDVTFL